MSKSLLWALIILALTVIVLLFNMGYKVDVNVLVTTIHQVKTSIVFFVFLCLGVIVGVLLK